MADSVLDSLTQEDLLHGHHDKKSISHKKINSEDNQSRGS